MLTARMFSSFLKSIRINAVLLDTPTFGLKERYFNGLEQRKPEIQCGLDFDPKWGEIRMNIVEILAFLALEEVHNPIGHGGCQYLPGGL